MRVVLDTNVFVAALLVPTGVAALILRAWSEHRFTLLFNTELLLELREVMARPRLRARVKRHRVGALIRRIKAHGERVYSNRNVVQSADPKDDFLFAIVQNGAADYLVSRDIKGVLETVLLESLTITPEQLLALLPRPIRRSNSS
jgi:uncharacterized protein